MPSDAMILSSVESSNLAPREKSHLRKWYEEMNGKGYVAKAKHHAIATAEAFRGGVEGLGVGAIVGILDSELKNGLDLPVSNGMQIPMDFAAGLLALAGSATMGPMDFVGTDMRNTGISLMAISGYRKTKEFMDLKKAQAGGKSVIASTVSKVAGEIGLKPKAAGEFGRPRIAGEADSDHIVALAKSL